MRHVVFVLIVIVLALMEGSVLATYTGAPDLLLAFAAWSIVAGDRRGMPLRIWLLGMLADLLIPGDIGYSLVLFGTGALLFLPVRSYLFATLPVSWLVVCIGLLLWEVPVYLLFHHSLPPLDAIWLVMCLSTLLLVVVIGWLAQAIPERLHPLGKLRA